jgi:hypothetical protein
MIIILISSTVSGLYMNKSVNPVFVNVSCGQTKQHSPVKCFNSTNSHRWIQDSTFQLVTGNITFTGASMCGPGPFATAWLGHTYCTLSQWPMYCVFLHKAVTVPI